MHFSDFGLAWGNFEIGHSWWTYEIDKLSLSTNVLTFVFLPDINGFCKAWMSLVRDEAKHPKTEIVSTLLTKTFLWPFTQSLSCRANWAKQGFKLFQILQQSNMTMENPATFRCEVHPSIPRGYFVLLAKENITAWSFLNILFTAEACLKDVGNWLRADYSSLPHHSAIFDDQGVRFLRVMESELGNLYRF